MVEKIRVLMVDDEEQFRSTTKKLLNRRGFETILAGSGEEAIERLGTRPHVVILDIKMPGMDGHQTLKEIKKRNPDIPIIMLTGHGTMPSAKEALVEGAFEYLSKPCDMDLLAAKITDARFHGTKGAYPPEEKGVTDVMIPIEEYTTLKGEQSVRDAILRLKESFTSKVSTSRIMETGHRSILVLDEEGKPQGILAIKDLLVAIMPAYLDAPKPSMADSIQYSPMFWAGMFKKEVKKLAGKKVKEIMSPAPLLIDAESNLMEVAYIMVQNNVRRLVVVTSGQVVGVIREQDLFFEMEKIIRDEARGCF
ncbi:MAG: histidine kinase [Nitrospira bacterium SG8_3]|nr:MAG: histidine kinase [Nitrospira bacterium SG8_3]